MYNSINYQMLHDYYTYNGWNNFFPYDKLIPVTEYLKTHFDNLTYLGRGDTCIVFRDGSTNTVIKICKKNSGYMKDYATFKAHSDRLILNKIKILPPLEVLYDDHLFFIYRQHLCIPVFNIQKDSIIEILEIVKCLIKHEIKVPNLYYKNFGVYQDDIYLFDYHDVGFLYSGDRDYIVHLAHLFSMYYFGKDYDNLTIDGLIENKFGDGVFGSDIVSLLNLLANYDFEGAVELFDKIIGDIKQ